MKEPAGKVGPVETGLSVLVVLLAATLAQAQDQPWTTDESPSAQALTTTESSRRLDLSSPRSAMRTFLVAIQDATGDKPERIDDAVRCLDTSGVQGDGEELSDRIRTLATRLHAVIDLLGVRLDDVPEETTDDE